MPQNQKPGQQSGRQSGRQGRHRSRRLVPALAAAAALGLLGVVLGGAGTGPSDLVPPAAAAAAPVHVAVPGDTWVSVARAHGLPPKSVGLWNRMTPPFGLRPDAVVRLSPSPTRLPDFTASVASVTAAQLGASYRPGCPVGPASLRQVRLTHWTPAGTAATGTLVVHQDTVDRTVTAFRTLYTSRVPIARMVPVSEYGGSDDASMAANNTSAFNCRLKTGSSSSWSEHSYGRAVDINPVQNPYVTSGGTVLPPAGAAYADRRRYAAGMLHAGGAVNAMKAAGFQWGGDWSSVKDYQHFSTTGR